MVLFPACLRFRCRSGAGRWVPSGFAAVPPWGPIPRRGAACSVAVRRRRGTNSRRPPVAGISSAVSSIEREQAPQWVRSARKMSQWLIFSEERAAALDELRPLRLRTWSRSPRQLCNQRPKQNATRQSANRFVSGSVPWR